MANKWNIPDWLEEEVKRRDKRCVYCGVEFTPASVSKKTSASWEHIINDGGSTSRENIALCCCGCNSSKGRKKLSDWLESDYCKRKGIAAGSVASIIKRALAASTRSE